MKKKVKIQDIEKILKDDSEWGESSWETAQDIFEIYIGYSNKNLEKRLLRDKKIIQSISNKIENSIQDRNSHETAKKIYSIILKH